MPITLHADQLAQTLERAYVLAIGKKKLPATWLSRAERLTESPSVGFIAAVGSVLLAKATDPNVDAFVIQYHEGGAGAFNLRAAATALARKKREYGYDIGSSSDRDPINQGTLVSSPRWDIALERIREDHKPFFQLILTWLPDVNKLSQKQAIEALAAYIRVRRRVATATTAQKIPAAIPDVPSVTELAKVLDGFVGANPQGGASGMALVAAVYRAAGFEATLPARNDPRPIDVRIKRGKTVLIGAEVKQVNTKEPTADSLARDAAKAKSDRALLAVLRPGSLVDFDRTAAITRAENSHGVILRVTQGSRELLHEAVSSGDVPLSEFCAKLPRLFSEALCDIRASEQSIGAWAAIASRWQAKPKRRS